VQVTNSGAVKTFRTTVDNGSYNANFYILIPAYTTPAVVALGVSNNGGAGIGISFPTQAGYGYQVEYKTNLTDAVWLPLGGVISGNGSVQSAGDAATGGSRFYRVRAQ
jgi:hypothetical protein